MRKRVYSLNLHATQLSYSKKKNQTLIFNTLETYPNKRQILKVDSYKATRSCFPLFSPTFLPSIFYFSPSPLHPFPLSPLPPTMFLGLEGIKGSDFILLINGGCGYFSLSRSISENNLTRRLINCNF